VATIGSVIPIFVSDSIPNFVETSNKV